MRHNLLAWTGAALLAAFAGAQAPPGGPVAPRDGAPSAETVDGTPSASRLSLGRDAVAAGNAAEAVDHLLAVLASHPHSRAACRELLRATADDPDARALFGIRLAAAALDPRGRVDLDRDERALLADKDPWPNKIARARADALAELGRQASRAVGRGPGAGVIARWFAVVADEIGREAGAAWAEPARDLDELLTGLEPDVATVVAGLRRLLEPRPVTVTGTEDPASDAALRARRSARELAVRAARVLTGLAAQRRFPDLKGPPPPADLGDFGGDARAAIERLVGDARADQGEPWTVERLQALSPEERRAFTAEHASWAWPAVAVSSPDGLYVIETVCGFDTLLAAANSVEFHHRRLATWYGKDPFTDRPGLVRIEPEHAGLESQGAPFWWAGGFQSGDVTTIRAAWTSREAMGRLLTHELTHRFDGTLKPFQPSWLTEGKAVWTGASYQAVRSPDFVEDYLAVGTPAGVLAMGYGNPGKLAKLIRGEQEEYRDNYPVGYSLFTFLRSADRDGNARFAERLERFMANGRGGRRDPMAFFVDHFADGQDGRPDGFEAFCEEFRAFLSLCARRGDPKLTREEDWIPAVFRLSIDTERSTGLFEDEPTWSWARSRVEPFFGQLHAAEAGRVLAAGGEHDAAAAAWAWALAVDGWDVLAAPEIVAAFAAAGDDDAAWAARLLGGRHFAGVFDDEPGPAPLLKRLSKLRGLLDALADAAAEHRAAGRPLAAAWLSAEHDDLARLCGVDPIGRPLTEDVDSLHPRADLPIPLGMHGFDERDLVGYEDARAPGLWFVDAAGDVHVGRDKPREGTGLQERAADRRDAFVLGARHVAPGEWVLQTRIHFTTAFVRGAVILGWTRRDQNVRLNFEAGDLRYATGARDTGGQMREVKLSLDELFERQGQLRDSEPEFTLQFPRPTSYFDLEIRVSGPAMRVFANGDQVFAYATTDSRAIAGGVGFATSRGAIRAQRPTIQRLDRHVLRPPEARADETFRDLVRRAVGGYPRHRDGTLILWMPPDDDVDWVTQKAGRVFRRLSKVFEDPLTYPQRWVFLVPPTLPPAAREQIAAAAAPMLGERFEIREHVRSEPRDREFWALFVDEHGIVRAAGTPSAAIPETVASWARRYRSR